MSALSGARKCSQRRDPGGDAWEAQKEEHHRRDHCFQRLVSALSGAQKCSQRRDPRGRRLGSTESGARPARPMIPTPILGPLWGSEVQPEARSWGETSGKHRNRSTTGATNDANAYCWPSLGLGNAARGEILGDDV